VLTVSRILLISKAEENSDIEWDCMGLTSIVGRVPGLASIWAFGVYVVEIHSLEIKSADRLLSVHVHVHIVALSQA
jgi:hypothetical protein